MPSRRRRRLRTARARERFSMFRRGDDEHGVVVHHRRSQVAADDVDELVLVVVEVEDVVAVRETQVRVNWHRASHLPVPGSVPSWQDVNHDRDADRSRQRRGTGAQRLNARVPSPRRPLVLRERDAPAGRAPQHSERGQGSEELVTVGAADPRHRGRMRLLRRRIGGR